MKPAVENTSANATMDHFNDPNWGAEQLQGISIFKKFSMEELSRLYQKGDILTLRPQSHAVIEGEPSRGLYIILHGQVSVFKAEPQTGNMARIAYLEKGASFGELSLFDDAPRSATVSADTYCYLFYLDIANFQAFLKQEGEAAQVRFYRTCAEDMASRFRAINTDYIISQQLLWKYALRKKEEADASDRAQQKKMR